MAGPDRTASVLKLLTLDRSAWTVEQAAAALGVSASSAYRYVAVLAAAGLLTPAGGGAFAFIEDADGNWIEISAELEVVRDRAPTDRPREEHTLHSSGRGIL